MSVNLRMARTLAGLSQEEAARRSGISVVTLSRYENGKREPSYKSLAALAPAYGMTVEELIRLEGPMKGNVASNAHSPMAVTMIPVMGYVSAGTPREAWEVDLGMIPIPEGLILRYPGIFALIISGDSLEGDGIFDGDIVFVDPHGKVQEGKIYIIQLEDGEFTVRHIHMEGGIVRLRSSNDHYEDLEVTRMQIKGKVVKHLRDLS